ncbi:MAG: GNAT family protein [candidate division KSB1 bacterium]|nr:GNAT family protein [candidate division KSB1 bacterium]MDQ7065703.1 GNAT family protein [candidate division KSB1 bacterium]
MKTSIVIPVNGDLVIRSYKDEDQEPLVKYINNRKIWLNLTDSVPHPYTRKDAENWIAHAMSEHPPQNFAIANGTELIGGIGLKFKKDVKRHSAAVGYWLGEPFWGKGIMTRVVRAFILWAFRTYPLKRISAGVYESNPASGRVLEKAGFILEGRLRKAILKNDQFLDMYLYSILREEVLSQRPE